MKKLASFLLFLFSFKLEVHTTDGITTGCANIYDPQSGQCFWLTTDEGPFDDVRILCENDGGMLTVLTGPRISQLVAQELKKQGLARVEFWLGVVYNSANNVHEALDGQELTWTNWKPGNPVLSISCAVGEVKGHGSSITIKWESEFCFDYAFGLCARIVKEPFTTPTLSDLAYQTTSIVGNASSPLLHIETSTNAEPQSSLPMTSTSTSISTLPAVTSNLSSASPFTSCASATCRSVQTQSPTKTLPLTVQPSTNQVGTIPSASTQVPSPSTLSTSPFQHTAASFDPPLIDVNPDAEGQTLQTAAIVETLSVSFLEIDSSIITASSQVPSPLTLLTTTFQHTDTSFDSQQINVNPGGDGHIRQTTAIEAAGQIRQSTPIVETLSSSFTETDTSTNTGLLSTLSVTSTLPTVATTLSSAFLFTSSASVADNGVQTQTRIIQTSTKEEERTHSATPSSVFCDCDCRSISNPFPARSPPTPRDTTAIIQELTLDKSKLSATRRRKTSVSDSRPASVGIGCVAAIFMGLVLGLFVLNDVRTLKYLNRDGL